MRLLKLSLNRIAVSRTGIGTVSVGVFLLLFLGCGQPPDLHDAETLSRILADALDMDSLQRRGKDGIYYAPNQSEPYTGWSKRMHKVGVLKTPSPQVAELIRFDAGREARGVGWHENGQMQREEHYEAGKRTGRWVRWHENGQMQREAHYEDGKRTGRWVRWYENGQMENEEHYEAGKLEGRSVGWQENGQMEYEAHYEADELEGRTVFWHENGQMEREVHIEDGKRTGRWVSWYENGQMESEEHYEDGERRGVRTAWATDGEKRIEFDYETRSFTVGGVDSVAQLPLTSSGPLHRSSRRRVDVTYTVVFETDPGCTTVKVSNTARNSVVVTLTNLWTGEAIARRQYITKGSPASYSIKGGSNHYRLHLEEGGAARWNPVYVLEVAAAECDD